MNNVKYYELLGFNEVRGQLAELATSKIISDKLKEITPFLKESQCKTKMEETTEAKKIIESVGTPPLSTMTDMDQIIFLSEKEAMLIPDQLHNVGQFINTCNRMKLYLKKSELMYPAISSYGHAIYDLYDLFEEIDRSIRNGEVDDSASNILKDLRRKIINSTDSIKLKLESILKSKKEYFTDGYIVTRGGRLVLPVKKEYKNQVQGTVVDKSATGSTYFIEPTSVGRLVEEVAMLKIDEENEIRKILYTLTALVCESLPEIKTNIAYMGDLDYIFAKAKLSIKMDAYQVGVNTNREINIINGRNPLILKEVCVPLNFKVGGESQINGVIITGPNTGGKTVALKTVGLLSLMAQCGLHVPADANSTFAMNSNVLCDIGDGQSISQNLSTFSSHITNIISILNNTISESLVLLDEVGSGTDPAEGMGIAVAILDELKSRNCIFIATTHYPEIKDYAMNTDGLVNARMEFDKDTLQPLYKMVIGEAGESCALYIAKILGFPVHMLNKAYKEAYGIDGNFVNENKKDNEKEHVFVEKIHKTVAKKEENKASEYTIGDSVKVYPQKNIGIVFAIEDDKGFVGIQVKGEKHFVNHKRLKLIAKASELYPEDYDFSLVFDSVEVRKKSHKMSKKHDVDLIINHEIIKR